MQAHPGYGYKQECYVYVEEDDFMKGDYFYDNDTNMQMRRPNEWIPTPPYNHHAPPHHGGYYEGMKHGKESYWPSDKEQYSHHDSWKIMKPRHRGGWPNDKQQYHHHDSWEMDKPSHGWPNDNHHDSWKMEKPSHGGKKHDGGYDNADDMFYSKMGGSGNGGGHHVPAYEPVVLNKHYGDDCENHPYYSEHKKEAKTPNRRRTKQNGVK